MDLVLDLLATVSRWSRSNLSEIALALVGCLLVLFGADFKGWVEQRLGSVAGALRVPMMALLCMVGSGAALIYATPWIVKGLSQFNNYSLALAQFVKQISHEAIRACSRDDAETFLVRDALDSLREALDLAGFDPQ